MRRALHLAVTLIVFAGYAGPVLAEEGMWTFDNFPVAAVKQSYGVTIDKAWLDHVQANAVRLSTGCSASIVSAAALVLTNNHCVRDCEQQLSTAGTDYVKNGFLAATGREEKECAGMQAEVLQSITDVTAQVNAAAAGKTGPDMVKAHDAAIAGIEQAACTGHDTQRCQVIDFYTGGQFKLYIYHKYSDVRLVFAPELQITFFGGDPDNFNFPRYNLDCSFVRLYEGGKPVATPDHLVWNPAAPKPGDLVFVAGNPGATQRLLTADQLELLRDVQLPAVLLTLAELRGRLIRFGEESPEHARVAQEALYGIENSYKARHGQEITLSDPAFIAAKRSADAALQAKIAADPKLSATIGNPWADVAKVQADAAALYQPYALLESRPAAYSLLYKYAVALVRSAEERGKPNGERLREYADTKLPLLEKTTLDPQPVYPEVEQLLLEFWLSKLRENLTADAPETKLYLGKQSPEQLGKLLAASKLSDPALRKKLWDGGLPAIQASSDPMIKFVLATDGAARAVRAQYEQRVLAPTTQAAARIAQARFAAYGTGSYPDATFSLRLSYGSVQGWTYQGITVPPQTVFKGLYERATGQPPFDLAPRWLAAQKTLNPDTVFDYATTNDITGGNSGSPLIDAKGQVVGAAFDGNIHSLGGAFAFDGTLNRTVAVSTASITEALQKVYGASALVKELGS